jgi:DNA topoisomerase IB
MCKEYFVTLEVPVQVTCSVRADTIVEAMAAAIDQVGKDGLESYHIDYDVFDTADVKRVEEL